MIGATGGALCPPALQLFRETPERISDAIANAALAGGDMASTHSGGTNVHDGTSIICCAESGSLTLRLTSSTARVLDRAGYPGTISVGLHVSQGIHMASSFHLARQHRLRLAHQMAHRL